MCSYGFVSICRYFLIFLKVCWPSFSKGIHSAFLVHVSVCCGAVCDVDSELPFYTCDLHHVLLHLGGKADGFF